MSVNIVNILAIYDINTLFGRGQARDSVPVPSVNARSESPSMLLSKYLEVIYYKLTL